MASVQILHWCYQGSFFFSCPAPVCVCVYMTVHSVYTCCNHFMDISERQIVKCQTRLFALLQGRTASARFAFDFFFSKKIKCVYCFNAHKKQKLINPGIWKKKKISCVQMWINKCDKHLAPIPPHLSVSPSASSSPSLARRLSSCVIPSTFFWKESCAARRFNSSQRMCGVGSFQHGSGSTKNSTAGPCQTILVPDVREKGRRGEKQI